MNKTLRITSIATLATLALTVAVAAKYNKVLDIGDKAPAWKDLLGVDGKKHSLEDLEDAKAVVVTFTCNGCPVARAYEKRMAAFAKDYAKKGVRLVAINVNNTPGESLEKMKEKGFDFAYLRDDTQKIAKKYGATVTPHFFLLDEDREIAYMGSFDDSQKEDAVENQHLRKATDAVLAGKDADPTEARPFGCGIKWDRN